MYATLSDLRENLGGGNAFDGKSSEYVAKMMHQIPEARSIDRAAFIVERCKGKRVLELGASGTLHESIREVAGELIGIDRKSAEGVIGFDLDDVRLPALPCFRSFPEIIVCGEIIEHLANPGHLLARLKHYPCPTLITVPNAFTHAARNHLARGIENVNRDHVAWYSWKTLKTLVERYGFEVQELYWYGGEPVFAQGLIMVVT